MRVFVTGATGFIGAAVVQELLQAGHRVLGLVRSDAGGKALEAAGAEVHRGDLEDLASLQKGVAGVDGVVHTGFTHDFTRFKEMCENDRRVIAAMGAVLEGSGRPLVVTSGIGILAPGRLAVETDTPHFGPAAHPRAASEEAVAALVARGVNVSVVRLPPSVHGAGDHAFVPGLIGIARAQGISAYLGNGRNLWPAVHRLDAAQLFRLALEKGTAGACYHGVAEQGVPLRDIAQVIGDRLNLPVVAKSREEAAGHFGWMAGFVGMDCPASSAWTQAQLGWRPTQPGLLADLDHAGYFDAAKAV
jgi:nucleoside-diphosphate-sugar epimerase